MRTTPEVIDPSREMDETQWWDLWNTSYRAEDDLDAIASELFERVAEVINGITKEGGCQVLEVACGSGSLSRLLHYATYHGLDISPAAIDIARQKARAVALPNGAAFPTYEAADFHDWPLPSQSFGVTVCVDAISSIREQQLALQKMARSLRPSGKLVLTTINRFVYERILRTPSRPLASGPVSHWLTRSELRTLIQSAGLTIERFETIMPRGNRGVLRLINARRLNRAFGPRVEMALRRLKERAGLGQYFFVVARKSGAGSAR
jgi:2-polyprenyl-3-methyl-5-hydroxy-6-metoxy-1,4-benzoquinol methylase